MKKFVDFIAEDEKVIDNNKQSVINNILSNFQRFINSADENDVASITMLSAAISLVSNNDSPQAIQSAKRLAQMALQRAGRRK